VFSESFRNAGAMFGLGVFPLGWQSGKTRRRLQSQLLMLSILLVSANVVAAVVTVLYVPMMVRAMD
jgi:hypothetical protein